MELRRKVSVRASAADHEFVCQLFFRCSDPHQDTVVQSCIRGVMEGRELGELPINHPYGTCLSCRTCRGSAATRAAKRSGGAEPQHFCVRVQGRRITTEEMERRLQLYQATGLRHTYMLDVSVWRVMPCYGLVFLAPERDGHQRNKHGGHRQKTHQSCAKAPL